MRLMAEVSVEAVIASVQRAGFGVGEATPIGEHPDAPLEFVGHDPIQNLDVHMRVQDGYLKDDTDMTPVAGNGFGSFNGLLVHEYGGLRLNDERYIVINALSTPNRINQVQRMLGRTPGIASEDGGDNASLFITGNGGEFTSDLWIPHAAVLETLVADWANWPQRVHDLRHNDHVVERMTRPTEMAGIIRLQFAQQYEKHWEAFRREIVPTAVRNIVDAEEQFSEVTVGIPSQVFMAARKISRGKSELPDELDKLQAASVTAASQDAEETKDYARYAKWLGLGSTASESENIESLIHHYRAMLGQSATMFLRAEILTLNDARYDRHRNARIDTFDAIAETFPAAA